MAAGINYTVEATLDSIVLNRVWVKWCQYCGLEPRLYQSDYSRVSKRSPMARKFEEWLYKEGAVVARSNKKCYLQFFDSLQATVFKLRYS